MRPVERMFRRLAVLAPLLSLIPLSAQAMTEEQYHQALKLAQEKVQRIKQASSPSALSSSIVKALYGKYYNVGDTWDVAAWELKNPKMGLAPVSESRLRKTGRGGIFRYEVKEVRNGATPEVVISVKQISGFGLDPVDPNIEELTLTMSDRYVQTQKAYKIRNRTDLVKVSPDGLHSAITPLELIPLDVPEVQTAIRTQAQSLPVLPDAIQKFAQKAGFELSLEKSSWMDQDDFFGRPIQILWQHGNPWPSYLRTDNGIAILIRSGRSS